MRFDDTNPTKEKSEFVESIKADIKWLGADWEDRLFFASDYFAQMYEAAVKLIQKGKAYVLSLIHIYRGREMYSAHVDRADVLEAKRLAGDYSKGLVRALEKVNRQDVYKRQVHTMRLRKI